MINGPSRFCGVSFEKLIEDFKREEFNGEYTPLNVKNNFIRFLEKKDFYDDIDKFIMYNLTLFKRYLEYEFENIGGDEFELFMKSLKLHDVYPFLKDFQITFDDILPTFVKNRKKVNNILLKAFSHSIFEQSCEVIISGFDEKTKEASYICFKLISKSHDEIIFDILNYETKISESLIYTFGDDDEVQMFLSGILPEFEENIYNFLDLDLNLFLNNFVSFLDNSGDFDEKTIQRIKYVSKDFTEDNIVVLNDLKEEICGWKRDRYLPIFNLTDSFPEDVLIDFIIFLINITSNRRKYSLDIENVGGDVLVGVIKHKGIRFVTSDNQHS